MARGINTGTLDRLEINVGKLVKARNKRGSSVDYASYKDNLLGFIREVLGWEPWAQKQLDMIAAIQNHTQTAVKGCVGAGKDAVIGSAALWGAYARGARVIIMGPTQRQIDEILFGQEIRQAWNRAKLPGELFQRKVQPDGAGEWAEIIGFVSKDVSALTGFHAPEVMIFLTEAQGVDDIAWEAAFATALGEFDRFVCVGNPLEPVGRFYEAFNANSSWYQLTISAFDHPNIVQQKTVIRGGPTIQALARFKKEEDDRYWTARVLAEFPDTATDAIITKAWWDNAVKRLDSPFRTQANGRSLAIGLDVARSGGDLCAAAVVQGPIVHGIETQHPDPQNPTLSTVLWAEAIARRYGMKKLGDQFDPEGGMIEGVFVVDIALMGGGVADMLKTRGWDVVEFNGSFGATEATEPKRYENIRAWGYWQLRVAYQHGTIACPVIPELLEELLQTRYEPANNESVKIIKKALIRRALGRSPDRADALMMAWTVAAPDAATLGGLVGDFGF